MKYLLLINVPDGVSDADFAGAPRIEDWLDDVAAARETGHQLEAPPAARTVRVRGGKAVVTDGPFVELKEWIAGFDIIEAPDLDTAVRIAAGHPVAHVGSVEVRPFAEVEFTPVEQND